MADVIERSTIEHRDSGGIFSRVFDENIRTSDVISDVKSFSDLMISPKICELLNRYGYYNPTPVQAKAIPLLLFGTDMLVQAKAGTGKTLVFAILAAKVLHEAEKTRTPQVLIVAPTREIAKQIYDTVRLFVPSNFWSGLFVGGTEVDLDVQLLKKGCQLAVGTCGRVAQLVKMKVMQLQDVQLFVLDEADKLMEEDFVKQVNYIFSAMPQEMKQTCVFSATYPVQLEKALRDYMRSPTLLRLNSEGEQQLIGVKEYCVFCEDIKKANALMILLQKLIFNQCIIFCDTLEFCGDVYNYLVRQGVDCTSLGSNLPQSERFGILKKLKDKKVRILVATDLMARGVDIVGIDLVINLSPSFDAETHMHRVGRAGRYGGRGAAITMLGNTKEAAKMCELMQLKALDIRVLDVCQNFPYDLVESNDDFHAKAIPFEKHPIIAGEMPAELSEAMSSMSIPKKTDNEESTGDHVTEISPEPAGEVPLRAQNRHIFYLRREIFDIYASRTDKEWIQYVCENVHILDYVCITGVMYTHPELRKLSKDHRHKTSNVPQSVPVRAPESPKIEKQTVLKPVSAASVVTAECASNLSEATVINQIPKEDQTNNIVSKKALEPFSDFYSIDQFREMCSELAKELEKDGSPTEHVDQSGPIVPSRLTIEQFQADTQQMIENRKAALSKQEN